MDRSVALPLGRPTGRPAEPGRSTPRSLFRLDELLERRFEAELPSLLERYPGAWVAMARDGVVAVNTTRADAEADALEWCPSGTFLVRPVTRARHPSTRLVRT